LQQNLPFEFSEIAPNCNPLYLRNYGEFRKNHPKEKLPLSNIYLHTKFSNCSRDIQQKQLECGPMPNLMVALPNIGGALCSTPQSLADAHY